MANEPDGPTEGSLERAGSRQADRDATLGAMHRLEAALALASSGREAPWRDEVLTALADLETAMESEAANAEQPDSLLSDLRRSQPRLRSRARGITLQYRQLLQAIDALRLELAPHVERPEGTPDVGDIRQRLAWLLMALRHQRARESELIHEAYFDAFGTRLDQR